MIPSSHSTGGILIIRECDGVERKYKMGSETKGESKKKKFLADIHSQSLIVSGVAYIAAAVVHD